MKYDRMPLGRRIAYAVPLTVLSLGVACSNSSQESSKAATDAPGTWAAQPESGEQAIECDGQGQHGTAESKFAFVARGENDVPQVIGRLTVAVDPSEPSDIAGQNRLNTDWTFPPNQERMYSYGIRDIPTIHMGSETFEISVGGENPAGTDATGYYVYCGRRDEPWPAPDLEPTF